MTFNVTVRPAPFIINAAVALFPYRCQCFHLSYANLSDEIGAAFQLLNWQINSRIDYCCISLERYSKELASYAEDRKPPLAPAIIWSIRFGALSQLWLLISKSTRTI